MRASDRKKNMKKANILAESLYRERKSDFYDYAGEERAYHDKQDYEDSLRQSQMGGEDKMYSFISKYVKDPNDIEMELRNYQTKGFQGLSDYVKDNLNRDMDFISYVQMTSDEDEFRRETNDMNEISSNTFKSAINVSKERGTDRRTFKLGQTFFNQFIGKPLLGGKITDIGITAPQQANYRNVTIEVTKSGYNNGETKLLKDYIYYDIDQDIYDLNEEIDRKDAVVLAKIASHINPNSKYRETGKYFKIKGY